MRGVVGPERVDGHELRQLLRDGQMVVVVLRPFLRLVELLEEAARFLALFFAGREEIPFRTQRNLVAAIRRSRSAASVRKRPAASFPGAVLRSFGGVPCPIGQPPPRWRPGSFCWAAINAGGVAGAAALMSVPPYSVALAKISSCATAFIALQAIKCFARFPLRFQRAGLHGGVEAAVEVLDVGRNQIV